MIQTDVARPELRDQRLCHTYRSPYMSAPVLLLSRCSIRGGCLWQRTRCGLGLGWAQLLVSALVAVVASHLLRFSRRRGRLLARCVPARCRRHFRVLLQLLLLVNKRHLSAQACPQKTPRAALTTGRGSLRSSRPNLPRSWNCEWLPTECAASHTQALVAPELALACAYVCLREPPGHDRPAMWPRPGVSSPAHRERGAQRGCWNAPLPSARLGVSGHGRRRAGAGRAGQG
eukprot:scaffold724_cov333-Prasinococcus_capsulatus_cf.AAC.2